MPLAARTGSAVRSAWLPGLSVGSPTDSRRLLGRRTGHCAPHCAQAAFTCYVRTRDYCSTSKHIVAMCLNVIKVSVEMGNYVHVNNYVQKAEQQPDALVRRARFA